MATSMQYGGPGAKMPMPTNRIPPYQPPTTPEELAREKERISLLLEINTTILQHITDLQTKGQGGNLGPAPPSNPNEPASEPKTASEDYTKCMRYLSYNIAYLTAAAKRGQNMPGTLPGPAIMEPPESLPALSESYQKLRILFPGWKGVPIGPQRMPSSAGLQSGQSMSQGMGMQGFQSGQSGLPGQQMGQQMMPAMQGGQQMMQGMQGQQTMPGMQGQQMMQGMQGLPGGQQMMQSMQGFQGMQARFQNRMGMPATPPPG